MVLSNTGSSGIALKSVHVEGLIDETLATMSMVQHYRNDSGENLEIVYTFPLPHGAVPLGMTVTVGPQRLDATAIPGDVAREKYESAIENGDMPVLMEQTVADLYTVNLGNVENGEDVTVALHYAHDLHFDHGPVRLVIPSAIAPRYGDQYRDGGLSPHENIDVDILAEYPMTLRLVLNGSLAEAMVECPSHLCSMENTEGGKAVQLLPGARLDRDCILIISGMEERVFPMPASGINARPLESTEVLTPVPDLKAKPLLLKILADCSGSMAGDGNRSVKEVLAGLLPMLHCGDHISYSRFGSSVLHETAGFLPWSEDTARLLANAFSQTNADLGGMETERAVISTLNDIPMPQDDLETPCVLLITGGHVWPDENIIRSARASGQRIFAIGVGGAPNGAFLRQLVHATGGACAFISPNESLVPAVMRMVDLMREGPAGALEFDRDIAPVCQSGLHLDATSDLAARRQLVSRHTALFMAQEREGDMKARPPVLHQVPQMIAAGHNGMGSARRPLPRAHN